MKPTIDSLCKSYKNEDLHSHHVCNLALAIFDAVYTQVKLPKSDRLLLRAAALLHDVGYASSPLDHQTQSAKIITTKGIDGFTKEQCNVIALIVLLHRKDASKVFTLPQFKKTSEQKTALALGSILRIADGLDHGHIQNCAIVSVKFIEGSFVCTCTSPGYNGVLAWAQSKADLWQRTFLCKFLIVQKPPSVKATNYEGIVSRNDTLLGAARKLLYFHYRIVLENEKGMLDATSDIPLHDVRIAMRRIRVLLQFFSPHLPFVKTKFLEKSFAALADKLGTIRDNDVWIEFLGKLKENASFKNNASFVKYYSSALQLKKNDILLQQSIIKSEEYVFTMRSMNLFLRIELSELIKKAIKAPLLPYAARIISALYFDVLSRSGMSTNYDAEKMHTLRKLCRRGRYLAEFFASALGTSGNLLAKKFKEFSDVLGVIHDADVTIERIGMLGTPVTKLIADYVLLQKKCKVLQFEKLWHDFRLMPMYTKVKKLDAQGKKDSVFVYLVKDAFTGETGVEPTRQLSKKGHKSANRLAHGLLRLCCQVDHISSSPFSSAYATATIISHELTPQKLPDKNRYLLPLANANDVVTQLSKQKNAHISHLLVGHVTQLASTAKLLVQPHSTKSINTEKMVACCLSFANGKIEANKGFVEWCFSYKGMRRIGERLANKKN